ncbi:Cys-rich peptide radical SAM maturase CcpM [Paenibacillus graminis]|uniref:Cys-rich peptide radical SAM maturase CcpM n=1 Tax=Paenibacillus graminis TaxID=189425 RepID=UPI002DBF5EDC|nr:Cys-rich peptide radical SAM maturase CcpM [Paenibacillus graminis]MEC0168820.1 Cys-rich peptide radical SAM maturase CcpM [Paenibacillus graminis]
MNIVFKTIKTPTGFFVYDRNRDALLNVSSSEYDELEAVSCGKVRDTESKVLSKYQKDGYLLENKLEGIEHPYTHTLEHLLSHHMEQLILQVTQSCNLRCGYCVYSGNYTNREHSNLEMDAFTAYAAIDMYVRCAEEVDILKVAFYGGEPLLKFELIQKCVEYIKVKARGKKIDFFITTNGTLLTKRVAKYLELNKFNITVSLDGPEKEHDRYRKFTNGEGSFNSLRNNLSRIKEDYPILFQKIGFNLVINPEHDYKKLKDFFEDDDLISSQPLNLSLVEPKDSTKTIEEGYSNEFRLIRKFDYLKLLFNMLGELDEQYISKFILGNKQTVYKRYDQIKKQTFTGRLGHHSGPCVPGSRRVFVSTLGYMYPCERVPETSEDMRIGHVTTGFDIEKIKQLLNIGKLSEDDCLQCWAFYHCNICPKKALDKNCLSCQVKSINCTESKKNAFINLKELCALKELGCTFNA